MLARKVARSFCALPISKEELLIHRISCRTVYRNLDPALYYEHGLHAPANPDTRPSCFTSTGAFAAYSGAKTGRSPTDKRIVRPSDPEADKRIWWGSPACTPMERKDFASVLDRAIDYLNNRGRLFMVDGYVGWDPKYRKSVRVFCTRPYHGLFMHNMMIRPTMEELEHFPKDPDFVIYNAGEFNAELGTTSNLRLTSS